MTKSILLMYLLPAVAFATVDPDPDGIGIYFDTEATSVCATVTPAVPFSVYLVITNPTAAEVWGIEFTMCAEVVGGHQSHLFRLGDTWYTRFIDLGLVYDWCTDGRVVSFLEPAPRVGDQVVLVGVQYMLLADVGVDFFLGPHPAESVADGLPAYLDGNGTVVPLDVSSGDPRLPVAQVGGDCSVVPVATSTFGRLKATYR